MSVFFKRFPDPDPEAIPLPGRTRVTYRLESSEPSERARITYELDPSGNVRFAQNGQTELPRAQPATVSSGGTTLFDDLDLVGNAPAGTIVGVAVVSKGEDNIEEVGPCSIEII